MPEKHDLSYFSKKFLMSTLLSLLLAAGILYAQKNPTALAAPVETASEVALDEQADQLVAAMSLPEKIGQMMLIGIPGPTLDGNTRALLQEMPVGGIILYDPNMQTRAQVLALNQQLQDTAGRKLPLFISIDEEGGLVARMKDQLMPPRSEEAIGHTGNPQEARTSAIRTSQELRSLGFNLNFAPVADVGSGRERSFSQSPAAVATFVDEAAAGYEQEHILYTLKHFPGIGKGIQDTHLDSVVVDAPLATLQKEDLLPFRQMIQTHDARNYFIMVTHVSYPALDSQHPASLSPAILTGLLRDELGYQGIIISDAMEMGALSRHYSFEEMGVKAIQAGIDILLVAHNPDHERTVYQGVLQAVQNGTIPESRINASVKRIVKVKLLHLVKKPVHAVS